MNSQKILNILNDLHLKDPASIMALVSLTVPTCKEVLEDYDVKIHKGYVEIGLLSILNKIIEDEDKKIALSYSIDSNAVMQPEKFVVRDI
jgi:c-di-GMP-related signal transduction protein